MKAIINGAEYPITYIRGGASPVIMGNGLPVPVGEIEIQSDDGQALRSLTVADWLRCVVTADRLTLTNDPAPVPPTAAELLAQAKADALARIDGKCSGAIYYGVTVGDRHFPLTPTAQQNLTNAVAQVNAGAASVPFAADGEALTMFTAEAISLISAAANDWGTVNIAYYAALKTWIAEETDTEVIAAIDYGAALPAVRMAELGAHLAGLGIDLTGYAGLLGGEGNA